MFEQNTAYLMSRAAAESSFHGRLRRQTPHIQVPFYVQIVLRFGVQKSGVVAQLPVLQTMLRRYC